MDEGRVHLGQAQSGRVGERNGHGFGGNKGGSNGGSDTRHGLESSEKKQEKTKTTKLTTLKTEEVEMKFSHSALLPRFFQDMSRVSWPRGDG